MSTKGIVVAVLLGFVAPVLLGAQSVTSVRVVRVAAVLERPIGEAAPVGSANTGEVLDVLDERDGWYLVRPPAGSPAREWRTGWVTAMTVEPMHRDSSGAVAQGAPAATTALAESTVNRKGFIVGVGVGAGLHRPPSVSVYDRFGRVISTVGGNDNFAIVTNFTIGYAPTDRVLLFYSNRAVFSTDTSYDALGVTGFGTTYMFRRTSPSLYVTGSIGGGFGTSLLQSTAADTGWGWSGGGGWEFARHFSLEGDVLVVKLNNRDHTVYRGLFHYTFY